MAASVAQLPPTAFCSPRDQERGGIASLFLPVRSPRCGAGGRVYRRHRHSRRHAVGDLGGQRGVYRRRGRSSGGSDHRVGAAHQSAGAATDLWRDLHRLAECRDHRGTDPGAAGRACRRVAGNGAIADRQAVPATVRHSRPVDFGRVSLLALATRRCRSCWWGRSYHLDPDHAAPRRGACCSWRCS